MNALRALNLGIRFFVVELGALAASAYWGLEATSGAGQIWLAIAAPVAVIVVWALFVSPKARVRVPRLTALAIELALLLLVAAGLAAAGPAWLGAVYGAVALASGIVNFALPG